MSHKKGSRTKKHLFLAKLADRSSPCVFCQRDTDDEVIYGKLYAIGNIHCHYLCVLLSCCLVQNGKDNEGLFGFLYPDILAEVERSKKHKCSYCGRGGATLGCSVSKCRKQFHLPCGRERDAVSLFFGNYKTFCEKHAPIQKVNNEIMEKVKPRLHQKKKQNRNYNGNVKAAIDSAVGSVDGDELKIFNDEQDQRTEAVCVICYETVEGYPTLKTFWPPCCARDAWFHRNCLQRMALSAGIHYLKCPLCNEKENFYKAVLSQGYYVPDRDAAWELERNAFAEIYERVVECAASHCACPNGRGYDADEGSWDVKLCILCGSTGIHVECMASSGAGNTGSGGRYVCATCLPVAPDNIDSLAESMETVVMQEEVQPAPVRRRPVMPCRMSLRRTKQIANMASSSSDVCTNREEKDQSEDITRSRLELNLKTPKKHHLIEPKVLKNVENKLLSPLKMLEQGLHEKLSDAETEFHLDSEKLLEELGKRLNKPKPLAEKKKIVNDILDNVLGSLHKEMIKTKGPIKEWISPKKCLEMDVEATEVIENVNPAEGDGIERDGDGDWNDEMERDVKTEVEEQTMLDLESEDSPVVNDKCAIKFSPVNEEVLDCNKLDIDVESFKHQYLNEVDRDYNSTNDHKTKNDNDLTKSSMTTDITTDPNKANTAMKLKFPVVDADSARKRKSKKLMVKYKKNSEIEVECKRNDDWEVKKSVKFRRAVRKDIRVRIRWRKERLKLKITESAEQKRGRKKLREPKTLKHQKARISKLEKQKRGRTKNLMEKELTTLSILKQKEMRMSKLKKKVMRKAKAVKEEPETTQKHFKQYVLKYSPETIKNKAVIEKPEHEVTPMKRKYTKTEKPCDGLVQTSLHDFFKPKPEA